ncbi:hypothetical protein A1O3_08251 [Capronia epimyces CBS 606.96]|uniref:Major facilitator superfamily (MFS) profile domain-containing protein n=1 Tax=Capronia epimyces CBS 606.96 TaxID=1182542 RepID=W9XRK8_9EURO|nr:uncharacterized protein A1O3_08251 [Capronia epimyces CBS 606.96]EXJ79965.1 hypothetical protein A1O3_08251 [Capronia epimyces CBS 606.96]
MADMKKSSISIPGGDTNVQEAGETDIPPTYVRKIVWKLDLCLLPVLAVCYMFQFMDKATLGYATLLGIITDANLHGTEYSWINSIFYFGYFFMSYPNSFLTVRLPIGKYLSGTVIVWGGLLMAHAGCHSFAGLMVTRFLLGCAEACVAPGFSLMTGMFYKREEQPLRHGLWFLGNSTAATFGGLVAWGIGHLNGSLAKWQYLFLILGALTSAWGVVMLYVLPDTITNARFLTQDERTVAIERVKGNRTAVSDWTFKWSQMWEALCDIQVWLLCLNMLGSMLVNSGLIAFQSIVIKGLGYAGLEALLLQMPGGAVQIILVTLSSICASFVKGSRIFMLIGFSTIALIGSIVVYTLSDEHKVGKLIGVYLMGAFACNIPISMSLISSNIAGATKKATAGSMLFVAYCVGNIISPQAFLTKEAPRYPTGFKVCMAGLALSVVAAIALRFYLQWKNYQRAGHGASTQGEGEGEGDEHIGASDDNIRDVNADRTDKEMKNFVYLY